MLRSMIPTVGEMRNWVTLEAPEAEEDALGGRIPQYRVVDEVPVAIDTLATRDTHDQVFTGEQPQGQASHRIRMRYYEGLSVRWRIGHGLNRVFNIYNIDDVEARGVWMFVYCREERR